MARFVIYIASGPNAACADFYADTLDDALVQAAVLWGEPVTNLAERPKYTEDGESWDELDAMTIIPLPTVR